jgi:hypothetical protein
MGVHKHCNCTLGLCQNRYINSFVVISPSDLSDHCLISINIQCENKSFNVEEENLWSLHWTFKWSDQNDGLYIDSLIEPDNSENILFLNKLLDDDSFNDTDLLVIKTNDIYIQAAKIVFLLIAILVYRTKAWKGNLKKPSPKQYGCLKTAYY